jgi:uncharacterized protein (DUF3084 family)
MASIIRQEIAALKQQVSTTGTELDRIKQEQETFSTEYYDFKGKCIQFENFKQQHGDAHPDVKKFKASKDSMEKHIRNKYINLNEQRQALINTEIQIFHSVKEVQIKVLDKELIKWKREQQLGGNGHAVSFTLETLQEW